MALTAVATSPKPVGRSAQMLSIASRIADLLVLAQPEKNSTATLFDAVDAAMFETGRPLVLIPAGVSSVIGNRIMIAWNGSTQAALVVTAALPLLHLAGQVDIVQIGDIGKDAPASELALHLSLHGIKTETHAIDLDIRDIGGGLIDAAERFESDLIVVGAYGDSRFRERILGGATRGPAEGQPVAHPHDALTATFTSRDEGANRNSRSCTASEIRRRPDVMVLVAEN